eukprot:2603923-Rhodomonas_salina.1
MRARLPPCNPLPNPRPPLPPDLPPPADRLLLTRALLLALALRAFQHRQHPCRKRARQTLLLAHIQRVRLFLLHLPASLGD